MKMTMHIDEDVLAQVMELTGAKSKTQAVEMALTEMARRHRMKKFCSRGLGMTPEELEAHGRDLESVQSDPPIYDEAAVQRFFTKYEARRAAHEDRALRVAEDPPPLQPSRQ
jgi:Arc/MetJ family transcription regulator